MRAVQGPNGEVVGLSDVVASGIVGDGNRGYAYVDEPAAEEQEVAKPTTRSSVKEIDAYAAAAGIDLSGAKTKPEKLAAIEAAESDEPPTGGEDDEDPADPAGGEDNDDEADAGDGAED